MLDTNKQTNRQTDRHTHTHTEGKVSVDKCMSATRTKSKAKEKQTFSVPNSFSGYAAVLHLEAVNVARLLRAARRIQTILELNTDRVVNGIRNITARLSQSVYIC